MTAFFPNGVIAVRNSVIIVDIPDAAIVSKISQRMRDPLVAVTRINADFPKHFLPYFNSYQKILSAKKR